MPTGNPFLNMTRIKKFTYDLEKSMSYVEKSTSILATADMYRVIQQTTFALKV